MTIVNMTTRQGGKSAIGNLVVLAMIGFGVWVGFQYIPQKIEQGTVRSVLDAVQRRHYNAPIRDDADLWSVIDKQLLINEMRDMRQNFSVSHESNGLTVRVSYERDLNLIFTTKKMQYNESLNLR